MFSSESLGLDIEIDGWFNYYDFFENKEPLKGVPKLEEVKTKISETKRIQFDNKCIDLMKSFNLPKIENHYKAFEELGLGAKTARSVEARTELMLKCDYGSKK